MERNLSLDILKMGLAFCVVFLHTGLLYDISEEISFLLVQGLFRIAVPTFLIISGYYFFLITSKDKFLKWLKKIVILFLIWNLFYLPLWFTPELKTILFNAINGYFVLWYLSGTALAGCMLFFLRDLKSSYLLSISFLIYITGWLIQEAGNIHIFSGIIDKLLNFTPLHRNFFFVCFPFLTLGFLINKHHKDFNKHKISINLVLIFLVMLLIESYLNYVFISKTEGLDQLFILFFAAPLLFIYVLTLDIKGKTKDLASLSTAIFLIHPLFMFLLIDYFSGQKGTLFSLAVLSLSIFLGVILVYLNRKIKYIL